MVALQFYNSETKRLEAFEPLEAGQVKLYVCGPTVYNDAHLGHARCYMTWDVLFRTLQFFGYHVNYTRNLTDVDDKIIQRAIETQSTPEDIAQLYTQRFHEDLQRLHTLPPTQEPKATAHIQAMQRMIAILLEKKHAYQTADGVYFDTMSMPHYGRLARKPIEALQAGARVDINNDKHHPADFALWKHVEKTPNAYGWDSPWGFGRPGWHIECSAMIFENLGEQIDIHAGGADLMFPHHENEIAQSECCSGHPFVKTWMHNGFVNVDGEKMSKSLGNFSTVRDLLEHYDGNSLRYFILGHHYRMPVDFSPAALNAAKTRFHKLLQQLATALSLAEVEAAWCVEQTTHPPTLERLVELAPAFCEALAKDMNTPKALAEWGVAFKQLRQSRDTAHVKKWLNVVLDQAWVLGFDMSAVFSSFSSSTLATGLDQHVMIGVAAPAEAALWTELEARRLAKLSKDFATSDLIRDRLQAQGFSLEDRAGGWTTLSSRGSV